MSGNIISELIITHTERRSEMQFTLEKVGNMVYLVGEGDIIFKAWMADEFTERKLTNAIKRISDDLGRKIEPVRKF